MSLLLYFGVSGALLLLAYRFVGAFLARTFRLSTAHDTPAHTMRDGLDYEPATAATLLPQHFSAIAAAGPVVGPILAGTYFGWGPAWLWLILGSIFVGGIHDFVALIASVRHGGKSVAEVVRKWMNPRAGVLFMLFIWLALMYVIVAFADVTAGTFVAKGATADAIAPGPGVAASSVVYLLLAVAMGLVIRLGGFHPLKAKAVFLPLVFLAILAGPAIPLRVDGLAASLDISPQRFWGFALLAYCFVAAMAPVWSLLQPRGELGGYFLYLVMGIGIVGMLVGGLTGAVAIEQPWFKGWAATDAFGDVAPLFPILFITVACGACSGFHSIVASGTTSKQLYRESDARLVGYGAMVMEGFFSCLALATLMIATQGGAPDQVFARGIAKVGSAALSPILPASWSVELVLLQFGLLCFATFVFDTLDTCTRLARYVVMDLFRWTTRTQAVTATLISLIPPALCLAMPPVHLNGKEMPLWRVFWNLFGSSNQLLGALTLLGLTMWLRRKAMAWWITFWPAAFMTLMTQWSLILSMPSYANAWNSGAPMDPVRHVQFGVSLLLLGLSCWLLVEAVLCWRADRPDARPGRDEPRGALAAA